MFEWSQDGLQKRLDGGKIEVDIGNGAGEHRDEVLLEHRLGHVKSEILGLLTARAVRPSDQQSVAKIAEGIEATISDFDGLGR